MQMGQVYRRARNHPSMHRVWKTWRHGRWRAGVPSASFSRQMMLRRLVSVSLRLLLASCVGILKGRGERDAVRGGALVRKGVPNDFGPTLQ